MDSMSSHAVTRPTLWAFLFCGAWVIGLSFISGCPDSVPTDQDGGTDGTTGGDVTITIISPTTSFGVSSFEDPITVFYTVTGDVASVSGFYIPVADASPGSGSIGDRVIIRTGLQAGENRFFNFDPEIAGVGFFRVGVLVTLTDATTRSAESDAVIQVEGPPDPRFILPLADITTVGIGTEVQVSFDAGDPENNVQWRLFFLTGTDSRSNPADQLGTELAVGTGNTGSFNFTTIDLAPGEYELGLSATDSGSSIAAAVLGDESDRIVTIPDPAGTDRGPIINVVEEAEPMPPTLTFSAPGTSDVGLFRDEGFTIRFDATINEPSGEGLVEIFYDSDRDVSNGFTSIAVDLTESATAVNFPTDLPEGTYNIGGTVNDGINPLVTTYATGQISVVREVTLEVTAPNTTVPVAPGEAVEIRWTSDAPDNSGTVDVFAQTVDANGDSFGDEIVVLAAASISLRSANFTSNDTGLFQLSVRLRLSDGALIQDDAPQPVRISTLPGIVWLGSLAEDNPQVEGAIFGGVNFEDNAGTSFTTAGDLDGDGTSEFVISARYGKPFFANPSGVGPGEAFLIYGASGANKLTGSFNLNSIGTSVLTGVTFAGIRTPEGNNDTDGMSSITSIPDVDGDGKSELVFGFPNTASRGHNASSGQDGVVNPRALSTLERDDQFLRGGIVIVSSRNSILGDPKSGSPTILLDLVGQDFDSICVEPEPEPEQDDGEFFVAVQGSADDDPPCGGECGNNNNATTNKADANDFISYGFVSALARDYFSTYIYSFEFYGGILSCSSGMQFVNHDCLAIGVAHEYCQEFTASCDPLSPGLHAFATDPDGPFDQFGMPNITRHSGYYPRRIDLGDGTLVNNDPREPLGARIIGVGLGDQFGTSLTLSNQTGLGAGDIIVSAPMRTARGILLGPQAGPEGGGEVNGLGTQTNANSGLAYLFSLRSLWGAGGGMPPKPHQYIVGEASHCSGPDALIDSVDAVRIAGIAGDQITNMVGIGDYNLDGRNDFAVGAPTANGGQGRVYIAYRREKSLEGDYVLEKLAADPSDPERLDGMLIVSNSFDGLGSSLETGFDFNNDGLSDLVIGSPNASSGVGEVLILFGTSGLVSPADGISVDTLLTSTRNAQGGPVAIRITGNILDADGLFGFNVANAGDIDGDGTNDLLIAAPGASPRFDPDPNDGTDALTELGVDTDLDGVQDGIPGDADLVAAGLVYVIFGNNRLDRIAVCEATGAQCDSDADCATGDFCASPDDMTINIDKLGTSQLRGFMIAGRRAGDRIGGGDAGDVIQGGISAKNGRGRSQGLATAGDVDGDGRDDILIGSVLADPRRDPNTDIGVQNGGEAYLIYGSAAP